MQKSGREENKENQELKEDINMLKKEMETLQNQLNQCVTMEDMRAALVIERQNMLKELKDSITDTGFSDTSRGINVSPTLRDSLTNVSDGALSQVYSGVEQDPESPKALLDVVQLKETQKSLEARVVRLEGEIENMLEEFQVTVSQGRDNISGSEQQPHLQTADLRNEVQSLHEELQNVKQEMLALSEQKESSEKEMQDAQEAVLKLQAECEKLHRTTNKLLKHQKQGQSQTQELYKIMKERDEKMADKELTKIVEDIRADMQTLENKVLLHDTAAAKLKKKLRDLYCNFCDYKETCQNANEKIFQDLDCKVDRTDMDHLRKQLEVFRLRILMLHGQPSDDAAVFKKECLTKFNCLSCDRPVSMSTPGPSIPVLPKPPSVPAPKCNRRVRQWTNLDKSDERSSTEGSVEQTREEESCGSDERVHKEVRLTVTPPKEGKNSKQEDKVNHSQLLTSKRKTTKRLLPLREQLPKMELRCTDYSKQEDKVNHSQLLTSSRKTTKRLLPLREQLPKMELRCTGTGIKKEKQWYPKESLPENLRSRQK
ncbi:glutamine-rich protein 2-like [Hemibagrus wyckioides]|uniref:glutamine-rich protein 2-like n=1 Tax=Hemibagrus wyckioides TaxID=337641 RepID=UPI00266BDA22|nr:glutamine-rich protein 2-like [Hemibagrus wyckioides]